MSTWVYVKSEPGLWTVGYYNPNGRWESDSDHTSQQKAAQRVAFLNGSGGVVVEMDSVLVKSDIRGGNMKWISHEIDVHHPPWCSYCEVRRAQVDKELVSQRGQQLTRLVFCLICWRDLIKEAVDTIFEGFA